MSKAQMSACTDQAFCHKSDVVSRVPDRDLGSVDHLSVDHVFVSVHFGCLLLDKPSTTLRPYYDVRPVARRYRQNSPLSFSNGWLADVIALAFMAVIYVHQFSSNHCNTFNTK